MTGAAAAVGLAGAAVPPPPPPPTIVNGGAMAARAVAAAVRPLVRAPAPAPEAVNDGGMAAVRAELARFGLGDYAETFDEEGYDDLLYLRGLSVACLEAVAVQCRMKPGHGMKFVDRMAEQRACVGGV